MSVVFSAFRLGEHFFHWFKITLIFCDLTLKENNYSFSIVIFTL